MAKKKYPDGEDESFGIISVDGTPYEIPEKGSIGLLALGYRGLMAWRARRIRADRERKARDTGEKGDPVS